MSNLTQQIVNHAWNFAHALRDDGLSFMGYTEQTTFLLFLKIAEELSSPPHNRPRMVPEGYDWPSLLALDGGGAIGDQTVRQLAEALSGKIWSAMFRARKPGG